MLDTLGRIDIEHRSGVSIARISGEIDISNVDRIERELEHFAHGRDRQCVVDLSEAEYFDSAGVRLLFSLALLLRTRRQELHVIVPASSIVRRLLEITDFARLVPVYPSMQDFLAREQR